MLADGNPWEGTDFMGRVREVVPHSGSCRGHMVQLGFELITVSLCLVSITASARLLP